MHGYSSTKPETEFPILIAFTGAYQNICCVRDNVTVLAPDLILAESDVPI